MESLVEIQPEPHIVLILDRKKFSIFCFIFVLWLYSQCLPQSLILDFMTTGAFGTSSLKIKGLVADGSNRQDANFGEGDTIEVLLNHEIGGGYYD